VIGGVTRGKAYRGLRRGLRETCSEFVIDLLQKVIDNISAGLSDRDNFFNKESLSHLLES